MVLFQKGKARESWADNWVKDYSRSPQEEEKGKKLNLTHLARKNTQGGLLFTTLI